MTQMPPWPKLCSKKPYCIWKRIIWVKGPYNLIRISELEELNKVRFQGSWTRWLDKLQKRLVCVGLTKGNVSPESWYKEVDIPMITRKKAQESDFSPAGKER